MCLICQLLLHLECRPHGFCCLVVVPNNDLTYAIISTKLFYNISPINTSYIILIVLYKQEGIYYIYNICNSIDSIVKEHALEVFPSKTIIVYQMWGTRSILFIKNSKLFNKEKLLFFYIYETHVCARA